MSCFYVASPKEYRTRNEMFFKTFKISKPRQVTSATFPMVHVCVFHFLMNSLYITNSSHP